MIWMCSNEIYTWLGQDESIRIYCMRRGRWTHRRTLIETIEKKFDSLGYYPTQKSMTGKDPCSKQWKIWPLLTLLGKLPYTELNGEKRACSCLRVLGIFSHVCYCRYCVSDHGIAWHMTYMFEGFRPIVPFFGQMQTLTRYKTIKRGKNLSIL